VCRRSNDWPTHLPLIVQKARDRQTLRSVLAELVHGMPAGCLAEIPISITHPGTLHNIVLSAAKSASLRHVLESSAIDAVMAGLCRDGKDMEEQNVVVIESTPSSFLIHSTAASEATYVDARYPAGREGAAMMGWAVQSFVRSQRIHLERSKRLLVIMTGRESRPEVRDAVTEALRDWIDKVKVLVPDTQYLAARGAAELAWRSRRTEESDANIEL
jgi:hypothetical protein